MNYKPHYFFSDFFLGKIVASTIVMVCFCYPISAISALFIGASPSLFNIAYRALIALGATYVSVICIYKNGLRIQKSMVFVYGFLLFYFIRLVYDTAIAGVTTAQTYFEIYSFFVGNICIVVLMIGQALHLVDKQKLIRQSFYVLIISNLMILLRALYQLDWQVGPEIFLFRTFIYLEKNAVGNDIAALINSITIGLQGGLLLTLSLSYLLLIGSKKARPHGLILYTAIILGLLNLLLGSSRGPMLFTFLSIVILFGFYVVFQKRTKKFYIKNLIAAIVLFLGISFVVNWLNANQIELSIVDRLLETKSNLEKGQTEERNEIYNEAFSMFLEKPIFGNQINTYSVAYPHNFFIEMLMSTGILGFLVYLGALVFLLLKVINYKFYGKYFAILFVIFLIFYGLSQTSGNIYQSVEAWCMLALILSYQKGQING